MDVGLTVTDRVTYHGLQWFNGIDMASNATLQQFLDHVGCGPAAGSADSACAWHGNVPDRS